MSYEYFNPYGPLDPMWQIQQQVQSSIGGLYTPGTATQSIMGRLLLGTGTTSVALPASLQPKKHEALTWLDRRIDEIRVKL